MIDEKKVAKAKELYLKWEDTARLRQLVLIVLFILTNSRLLIWFAMSWTVSPVQTVLAAVLVVAEDILFSFLWWSKYCQVEDIQKQLYELVDNMNRGEKAIFVANAYHTSYFYNPVYEDDPDTGLYGLVICFCALFSIIPGWLIAQLFLTYYC